MNRPELPAPGAVTILSKSWCPFCRRLIGDLAESGVDFEVIDVEANPQFAAFVRSVNNGNETVPTVLFPDGSTSTNPAAAAVRRAVA